ncbi:MAG: hypothetical protein AB7E32_03730 [Desulfovibrio sp.]
MSHIQLMLQRYNEFGAPSHDRTESGAEDERASDPDKGGQDRVDFEKALMERVLMRLDSIEDEIRAMRSEREETLSDFSRHLRRLQALEASSSGEYWGAYPGPVAAEGPTYRTQLTPPKTFLSVRREDWRDEHTYRR